MYKNGHRGIAFLLMAPLTAAFGIVGLTMSAVAFAVCRLPDRDHDYGWLSHRGPMHTIWFAIAVAAIATAVGYVGLFIVPIDLPAFPLAALLGTTVFLGLLSHLLADGLTVGWGDHTIRPFRPLWSAPFRLGLLRTDPLAGTRGSTSVESRVRCSRCTCSTPRYCPDPARGFRGE